MTYIESLLTMLMFFFLVQKSNIGFASIQSFKLGLSEDFYLVIYEHESIGEYRYYLGTHSVWFDIRYVYITYLNFLMDFRWKKNLGYLSIHYSCAINVQYKYIFCYLGYGLGECVIYDTEDPHQYNVLELRLVFIKKK